MFLLFLNLFQRSAKLVGAGSPFRATTDAVQFRDDIIDLLSCNESADALQIAIASAHEKHLLDDVVVVNCHINQLRASSLGLILNVFHFPFLFYDFFMRDVVAVFRQRFGGDDEATAVLQVECDATEARSAQHVAV